MIGCCSLKRFDRLIAILLLLQTTRLLRAADLAARFQVSDRTIYRDMRSLETAGVPIVAEPGLGYYLDRGYQLPAVNFDPEEAIALLVGVKGVQAHVPGTLSKRAESAMDKLLAVMDEQQQDHIRQLQSQIAISSLNQQATSAEDTTFDICQQALITRRTLNLTYTASYNKRLSKRVVEPVGLSHYSGHWHLIAWCRLRVAMRDFRLDRVNAAELQAEPCPARPGQSLVEYLASLEQQHTLSRITVAFTLQLSSIVGVEKYKHGYIKSELSDTEEIMDFLTAYPVYLGRWLLQFTSAVRIVNNPEMLNIMKNLTTELQHYN